MGKQVLKRKVISKSMKQTTDQIATLIYHGDQLLKKMVKQSANAPSQKFLQKLQIYINFSQQLKQMYYLFLRMNMQQIKQYVKVKKAIKKLFHDQPLDHIKISIQDVGNIVGGTIWTDITLVQMRNFIKPFQLIETCLKLSKKKQVVQQIKQISKNSIQKIQKRAQMAQKQEENIKHKKKTFYTLIPHIIKDQDQLQKSFKKNQKNRTKEKIVQNSSIEMLSF